MTYSRYYSTVPCDLQSSRIQYIHAALFHSALFNSCQLATYPSEISFRNIDQNAEPERINKRKRKVATEVSRPNEIMKNKTKVRAYTNVDQGYMYISKQKNEEKRHQASITNLC